MPEDVIKICIDTHTGKTYADPYRASSDPDRFVLGYVSRAVLPMLKKSWRVDHGYASCWAAA
jgi:hypothetical protein